MRGSTWAGALRVTPAMMMAALAVLPAILATEVQAEPPRVVSASPDMADVGVDPSTDELRIEFDQDMDPSSRSICGGGTEFPKIAGAVRWESPRVLVVPIALEAGRRYSLSINCASFRNFRSVGGESAVPYPIRFMTAKEGESPAAPMEVVEVRGVLDRLETGLLTRYAYRDRMGVAWAEEVARLRAEIEASPEGWTISRLGRRIARMLAAAEDPHVVVRVRELGLGTDTRDRGESTFDGRRATASVPGLERRSSVVYAGRRSDGVGYVLVTSWAPARPEDVDAAFEVIREMVAGEGGLRGLIVDVRPNGGGDELLARRVAGALTSAAAVYSTNRNVDPEQEGGWTQVFERRIEPAEGGRSFGGPVACLIGPSCMSSNESFILMLKHGAGARLFGARTAGSSGNPKPWELTSGLTLLLPSWQDMTPEGVPIEGRGIEPDEAVVMEASASGEDAAPDPVIEAAAAWILGQSGESPR